MIMTAPEADRISMHAVSPPYFRYSLPQTGIEPREPQHRMIIGRPTLKKTAHALSERHPVPPFMTFSKSCIKLYQTGERTSREKRFRIRI
jgi:hypothetical protein